MAGMLLEMALDYWGKQSLYHYPYLTFQATILTLSLSTFYSMFQLLLSIV